MAKGSNMRHVPLAAVKDNLSQYAAAAAGGDEIVVTRHGKPYVRLVALADDEAKRRRRGAEAAQKLYEIGQEVLRRHGPTPIETIVTMINEDRK
jgi:prevent-host-death family protein